MPFGWGFHHRRPSFEFASPPSRPDPHPQGDGTEILRDHFGAGGLADVEGRLAVDSLLRNGADGPHGSGWSLDLGPDDDGPTQWMHGMPGEGVPAGLPEIPIDGGRGPGDASQPMDPFGLPFLDELGLGLSPRPRLFGGSELLCS
jgi:hypothetical protein